MNRNKNLKIVGFFGQSGAGKTTIIRNVRGPINGQRISPCTGIIRYLFNKNKYLNPADLYQTYEYNAVNLQSEQIKASIDEMYEKYIKSQLQLLNDFSTEVFLYTQTEQFTPAKLLTDRTPLDFYALTLGGVKYLESKVGIKHNAKCEKLISICKSTAEENTKNFYESIFITYPWKDQGINKLKDGVRDQYLTEFYTGDNWYNILDNVDIGDVKVYSIDGEITNLYKRAKVVEDCLLKD